MEAGSETPNPENLQATDPTPASLPAPLAVPVLQPPSSVQSSAVGPQQGGGSTPSQGVPSDGAIPRASTEHDQTVIIRVESKKGLGLGKLLLTVAVAAVVAYAGILWQHRRLIPAAVEASLDPPRADETTATQAKSATAARAASDEAVHAAATVRLPEVQNMAEGAPSDEAVRSGKRDTPENHAVQGYMALDRQQYAEAARLFHQTLAESPSNGTAMFGLAEAYRSLGHRSAAIRTYRRYVEVLPKGPDAGRARAAIRALESKKH